MRCSCFQVCILKKISKIYTSPDQTYQFGIKLLIGLISTTSYLFDQSIISLICLFVIKRFVVSKLDVGFGEQDLCPWNSNIVYAWLSNYQMARAPVLYTVAYLRTRILQLGNGELSAVREHFWNDGTSY